MITFDMVYKEDRIKFATKVIETNKTPSSCKECDFIWMFATSCILTNTSHHWNVYNNVTPCSVMDFIKWLLIEI